MRVNYILTALVMIGFFVLSFVTNILGPITPQAIKTLNLTLTQAGILPFAFFSGYIISIPAGYMIEKKVVNFQSY